MKTSNAVLKPCIQAYLNVKDADKAIEFYKKAFGAKEKGRITVNGKVGHAELEIGDSAFMVAEEMKEWGNVSPSTLGGTPVGLCLYVEDVDTVYKNALAAGGKTEGTMDVKDQFYGDRSGNLIDPFGHKWVISTHMEDVSWEELQKRSDEMMKESEKKYTSL
ncbi:MAG: VOC family protein [Bacteroidota bacterium]